MDWLEEIKKVAEKYEAINEKIRNCDEGHPDWEKLNEEAFDIEQEIIDLSKKIRGEKNG